MHITFDMDDTLTATHQYIRDNLEPTSEESLYAMVTADREGHAYVNAGAVLQTDIYEQILRGEEFMLESGVAKWVRDEYEQFCELITTLKNLGHTFSICTHRGWTETGSEKTMEWLKTKALDMFEVIHCLDSKVHPCKLTYLEDLYGRDFIIVDDNPYHGIDRAKELDFNQNVIQCVGEHIVPEYVHFRTFDTFTTFKEHLLTLLGVDHESI
ncbi:hypothetical protein FDJ25_gp157 [Vibrio phage Aphrodite1]|uniref:Uncharacterized protein n=1 Tax=Vibrio phage Aphrodite1 TaxID=2070057 RepID=A0A2I7QI03_9CAUD|nr:hypothetical protein FDJ25_gp157 [Vibrio phage Aphrodite1]AUR81024.1 hypothetical protein Aphrodite1_0044 [Vibrio phage Aphrodite1]